MNIIVTIKQVADPNIPAAHIQLDASGQRVVSPPGMPPVINGYDANALEEALRLREAHGGRVTALGLGDDGCRDALKGAIAMGADAAILLNDPQWENADSAGIAQVLAAAARKIGAFDLILCGRQASDTDAGQVLFWLAHAAGVPVVSPVSKVEVEAAGSLLVHRLIEEGHQKLRVKLPALLGISSEINEPRYPPPRGVMKAERTLIPGWKAGDVAVSELIPRVELRKLEVQLRTSTAQMIAGASGAAQGTTLADKLHEQGLI